MKLTEAKTLNMTEGPIGKLLIRFAIPLLIGNLFQLLYNLVDSLIIGNYEGTAALAAVGIGHYPLNICVNFFLGLGTGVTVLVSQSFGAGDNERLRRVIANASSLVIVFALPLMLLGYFLADPILHAVNTPEDTYQLTYSYMVVLFVGIAGNLGYNMNAGILRGVGDSVSPLLFLIFATVANIILDFLFIGLFRWSAFGAALATVIAQWSSWIFSIVYINRKYPEYRIRPLRVQFDASVLPRILKLGLPIAVNQGLFALGHTMLSGIVNSNGMEFSAGYNISSKLDSLSFLVLAGFSSAVTTFAGQNIGASVGAARLRKGFQTGLGLACISILCTSLFMILTVRWTASFFDSNPATIEVATHAVYRFEPYYLIYTVFYVLNAFLNGVGIVKVPLIANLFLFWGVRLPAAYLLNLYSDPVNLFFCYPISWIGGLIINLPYFLSGRWKKRIPAAVNGAEEK